MGRIDKERQNELQPIRMQIAIESLKSKGVTIHFEDDTSLKFMFKGNEITFFPYSGWHTGKGIKDGRGIKNLLKQL